MELIKPPADGTSSANRLSNPMTTGPNHSTSAAQNSSHLTSIIPNASTNAPTWTPAAASTAHNGSAPTFSEYSATTAEILKRVNSAGKPSFDAAKERVLQTMITSDKLPTPPPITSSRGRGRGGRIGTPSALKTEFTAEAKRPTSRTPTSARGRGRGRGRGGGRGGKRKRAESVDSENDSDISSSYTPLPTKTKSGRNVNKPVSFVPTIPEPSPTVKRRKSTKTRVETALCNICHRGTSLGNNQIVFCDGCNTPYHQYCHDPPIEKEVVQVIEKEWLCGPCERSRRNAVQGTEDLVTGDTLSLDEKRAYFSTLPQTTLVSLLLLATIRHPELPIFPANINSIVSNLTIPATNITQAPSAPSLNTNQLPTPAPQNFPPPAAATTPNLPNAELDTTGNTPRSQHIHTDSELDPAEAQLLGEIRKSHQLQRHASSSYNISSPPALGSTTKAGQQGQRPLAAAQAAPSHSHNAPDVDEEYEDDYESDPPAHFPKPGNGLARTMRSESEDLQWMVDDNFEVFSHSWKGEGSGGNGGANGMGVVTAVTAAAIVGATKLAGKAADAAAKRA